MLLPRLLTPGFGFAARRYLRLGAKPSLLVLVLSGLLAGATGIAAAAAYRPADDSEVLEQLPLQRAERRQLSKLRQDLVRQPQRPELAFDLAQRYIAMGRAQSDPRFYGYAEAVLTPWVSGTDLHPQALLLRATILQNRHAFQAALQDLEQALRLNPRLPQAWLTRAAIQEVQGKYPEALRSCLALGRLAAEFAATVCLNSALSLAGQAESAYERLSTSVTAAQDHTDTAQLAWARGILAELAERLHRPGAAASWYLSALAAEPDNVYLRAAFADFLLAQRQPAAVCALLQDVTRIDALLLRLTLAEQQLEHADFATHAALLKDRFAASQARGDATHQGDEARFTLYVLQDSDTALSLARANWSVQREPRDARILLETALATKNTAAVQQVGDFLRQTRLQDARLQTLLNQAAQARL